MGGDPEGVPLEELKAGLQRRAEEIRMRLTDLEGGDVCLLIGEQDVASALEVVERSRNLEKVCRYWVIAVQSFVEGAAYKVLVQRGVEGETNPSTKLFRRGRGRELQELLTLRFTVSIVRHSAQLGTLKLPVNIEQAINAWLEEWERMSGSTA